jgi:hypothetical protein
MESTGIADQVQLSVETAELLRRGNKGHWLKPRKEAIEAKGKGRLETYFLAVDEQGHLVARRSASAAAGSNVSGEDSSSVTSSSSVVDSLGQVFTESFDKTAKRNRIAEWTVEVMTVLLKEIELRRLATNTRGDSFQTLHQLEQATSFKKGDQTVIGEVCDIVELPENDEMAARKEARLQLNDIELGDKVVQELRVYIQTIASMYRENGKSSSLLACSLFRLWFPSCLSRTFLSHTLVLSLRIHHRLS